jgi:hypothetical protein
MQVQQFAIISRFHKETGILPITVSELDHIHQKMIAKNSGMSIGQKKTGRYESSLWFHKIRKP